MDNYLACEALMVFQLALLLLHQMDSTFFKEWEMVPALRLGYTAFFVLTIALAAVQVVGIMLLVYRNPLGAAFAVAWGFLGLIVPVLHTYFYLKGDKRFRSFWSAAIIYVMLPNSVLLIVYGFKTLG